MDHAAPTTLLGKAPGTTGRELLHLSVGAIVFAVLIYIAGTKPIGISADLRNYEILYDRAAIANARDILFGPDAAFFILAHFCARLGMDFNAFAFVVSLLTMAFLAASIKGIGARPSVLLFLYLSYLFWLHPYTQMRTGLGLSLLIFGLYSSRKFVWPAIVGSVAIHNSLIIAVAGYIGLRIRLVIVAGIVVAAALGYILGPLQSPLAALSGRALAYQDLALMGRYTEINIFSLMPLAMLLFLALAVVHIRILNRQEITEGILSIIGVSSFYILRDTPVLAFRVYEIFMIFFVILAARLWDKGLIFRFAILPYVALGLRATFFSETSLIVL